MTTIKKPDSNFMEIGFNLSYSENIVLPYKEGLALMASLENAKKICRDYGKPNTVKDLSKEDIKSSILGSQEYGEIILQSTISGGD
jgi:hypothetical protein